MLSLLCVVMLAGTIVPEIPQREERLDGVWDIVAIVTQDRLDVKDKGSQRWVFNGNDGAFRSSEESIPRDGAIFSMEVDKTRLPNRLKLSYHEGDETCAFAYCAYRAIDDCLLIRMRFTFAPALKTDEFAKSPYPSGFLPKEHDGTALFIMRRKER